MSAKIMTHGSHLMSLRQTLQQLRTDNSGLALIEFALAFPLLLAVGCWGVELSSLALTNLRISQFALNLADSASRVGVEAGAGVTQLREADINDTLQGVRLAGSAIDIANNGRVTLSSLENVKQSYDTDYVQRIHWQRCFGKMSGTGYDSSYGTTTKSAGTNNKLATAGTTMTEGMGDPGTEVNAPRNNAVMFVEINYRYQPLFGSMFMPPRIIHYTASLMVRDNRDYTRVYNPLPKATASTCDKHTA